MESRIRYLTMAKELWSKERLVEWDSQRDVKKIIIFHFINYTFLYIQLEWSREMAEAGPEQDWEVFSLAHRALLIYLFPDENLRSRRLLKSHSTWHSTVYFSISVVQNCVGLVVCVNVSAHRLDDLSSSHPSASKMLTYGMSPNRYFLRNDLTSTAK